MDDAVQGALYTAEQLLAAVDGALDALSRQPDSREKFKAYGELGDGLRARAEEAYRRRPEVASAIREAEKLGLRPLAADLDISTTRLHQMLNPGTERKGK